MPGMRASGLAFLAAVQRVLRVAFDLDRPAVVRLHQHRDGAGRAGASRSRNTAARRACSRAAASLNGMIFSSGRRQPVVRPTPHQQERGGHDLDEVPAGHRVGQLAGAVGELALDPFPEARACRPGARGCASTSGRSPAPGRQEGRSSSVTGGAVLELFDLPVLDQLPHRPRAAWSGFPASSSG